MTERVELTPPLRVGAHEIIVAASVRVHRHEGEGVWLTSRKQPIAVLVKTRGVERTYDVDGKPLSAEQRHSLLRRAGTTP